MIKINLVSRKHAMNSSDAKGGRSKAKGAPLISLGNYQDLPLRKFVLALVVGFFASYLLDDFKTEELNKIATVVSASETEQSKLQAELSKAKGFEEVKKQLEADEFTIRTKMETIQKLAENRGTPPKMLMALSTAIPADVWLNKLKVKDSDITLNGAALGFNQISDFMKSMNENIYFKDLKLVNTQQIHDESGRDVASFELSAKRR